MAAIPTLRMLTEKEDSIAFRGQELARQLAALADVRLSVDLVRRPSKAGGGALPLLELPSCCLRIRIQGLSVNALERRLRRNEPPIIARIEDDACVMDLRTVQEQELGIIASALSSVLQSG
jgi:L-seryl-tRNA(Ser) seleniumtransferase